MRLHAGLPPDEFQPAAGWQALQEPPAGEAVRRALPLGAALCGATALAWHLLGVSPWAALEVRHGWGQVSGMLLGLVLLVAVHEIVHVLAHPGFGATRHTVLGASAKPWLVYASYQASLSRNRFIVILLAPFVLLTLLPLLAHAAGLVAPPLAQGLAAASTVNAALASVDVFGALLLARQVPAAAEVRNQGWQTWWRRTAADPV